MVSSMAVGEFKPFMTFIILHEVLYTKNKAHKKIYQSFVSCVCNIGSGQMCSLISSVLINIKGKH